jgi:hypothetical protein
LRNSIDPREIKVKIGHCHVLGKHAVNLISGTHVGKGHAQQMKDPVGFNRAVEESNRS